MSLFGTNEPNQGQLANYVLRASVIDPPIGLHLQDDVHDVPFKLITQRSGPLANKGAPESDTTKLVRQVTNLYGSHISIIKMYDHFLLHKLPKKIVGTVIYPPRDLFGEESIRIEFTNVRIMKPSVSNYRNKTPQALTPRMARLQRHSYNARVFVDVVHYNDATDEVLQVEPDVNIINVPVMVGSVACYTSGLSDGQLQQIGECPCDTFGYFIQNGSEKFFKNKENIRYNIPATYVDKSFYETRFTCFSSTAIGTTLFVMRLFTEGKSYVTNVLFCRLQHFSDGNYINVFSLFRLLGWSIEKALKVILLFSDQKPANQMAIKQKLSESYNRSQLLSDSQILQNLETLRKERPEDEQEMLTDIIKDLFANLDPENIDDKLYSLAFLTSHTVMFILGIVSADDRNAWSNKKIQSSANTVESAFNSVWCGAVKKFEESFADSTMKFSIENYSNYFVSVEQAFNGKVLGKKVCDVFSGKSKSFKGAKDSKPLSEEYKKNTPIDGTSLITKTTAQTSSQNKKNDVRVINKTQLFFICLAETPENANIGVVKNMAYACWLSLHHPGPTREEVIDRVGKLYTYPFGEKGPEPIDKSRKPLFVNGELYGFLLDSDYPALRELKYSGFLSFDSCIHYNPVHETYEVFTTDTRPTAPMLRVENGKLVIDEKNLWGQSIDTLLENRAIEWMDARELEYAKVAKHVEDVRNEKDVDRYTHSCIQTNMLCGWAASITPWQERNKGPRNIYQAAMSKQAQSGFSTVHNLIYETSFKILNHAVRPLCESNTYQLLGMESMPNSQNVMMAILVRPDNNEDALEIKEESLRGNLFRVSKYITVKVLVENGPKASELLAKPNANDKQSSKYINIGEDGLPQIGSYIKIGDCIVGKLRSNSPGGISFNQYTGRYETSSGEAPVNVSKMAGIDEEGFVSNILVMETADGVMTVRVKLLQTRMYECGDKLALRYSQKGTVGNIVAAKDMPTVLGGPFDGLQVDEMFSALSIPTRMTASLLLEMISGLASLFTGERVDSTSFERYDIDKPSAILRRVGQEEFGMTGEELEDFSQGMFRMARPDGKPMGEWKIVDGEEKFFPTKVFLGPMSPQVLRHHVADKFQVRRTGSVNILTRQGRSGRSRNGALRFGEMESDAVKSVGGSHTLLERLKTVADEYKYFVCSCGADAISIPQTRSVVCSENKNHGKSGDKHSFGVIKITYISLLIKRLLAIAGINLKFYPKVKE